MGWRSEGEGEGDPLLTHLMQGALKLQRRAAHKTEKKTKDHDIGSPRRVFCPEFTVAGGGFLFMILLRKQRQVALCLHWAKRTRKEGVIVRVCKNEVGV